MSALKRKTGPDAAKASNNPAKRKKTDTPEKKKTKAAKTEKLNGAKASKTDKPSKPHGTKADTTSTPTTTPRPAEPSVLTLLKDEEPMFPRGGGSVLTPLERKQIQMKASADAADEDELEVSSQPAAGQKKERRSKKSDKQTSHPVRTEDSVRVESLNFKVRRHTAQHIRLTEADSSSRDW